MTDPFRCVCGRVWFFPDYVQEHSHILYTLICDCPGCTPCRRGG